MTKMRDDIWAVTTYFNPCGYKTRRSNYERFIASLQKQGVRCLTVECAFGDAKFELPQSKTILQVRAESLLWQKERLLNLGVAQLPSSCKYVAWLDADILFEDDSWAQQAVELLSSRSVIQLFTSVDRLDQHGESVGDLAYSFGAIAPSNPYTLSCGRYDMHGHTGYAWAMTKALFDEVGLYEHSVVGSSDHFMAHAIYNVYGFCVEHALMDDQEQLDHLKSWGERFYGKIQGEFTALPGRIKHLWHGDLKNRRYFLRMHDITNLGYNPMTDVKAEDGKPLAWTETALKKPGLAQYFYNYFAERQEDGA